MDLQTTMLGDVNLHECPKCEGLWLDVETFDTICADREKQAAVVGSDPLPTVNPQDFDLSAVRYVGCCVCHKLMNRMNFARQSGVIVDICKPHGIWFDREELRRIVEFIRAGGLEKSRERDRQKWAAERRQLEATRRKSPGGGLVGPLDTRPTANPVDVADAVVFVGRVLWKLLD